MTSVLPRSSSSFTCASFSFTPAIVPLANDEGGNLFAYSIRNGEEGAIYYYSHEFEYGENPEKYIKYLSKDIDAFLNSLDFEEEEE